jgi:hypothetical protein
MTPSCCRLGPGGEFDRDERGESLPPRTETQRRRDAETQPEQTSAVTQRRSDAATQHVETNLGELLFRLRLGRGLAHWEVAADSGLSLQRCERSEWGPAPDPSDVDRIVLALDRRTPLTAAEVLEYLELSGLLVTGGRERLRTLAIFRGVEITRPRPEGKAQIANQQIANEDGAIAAGGVG